MKTNCISFFRNALSNTANPKPLNLKHENEKAAVVIPVCLAVIGSSMASKYDGIGGTGPLGGVSQILTMACGLGAAVRGIKLFRSIRNMAPDTVGWVKSHHNALLTAWLKNDPHVSETVINLSALGAGAYLCSQGFTTGIIAGAYGALGLGNQFVNAAQDAHAKAKNDMD